MSFDRLLEKIQAYQNPTVVGLDPKLDYLPDAIKAKSFQAHGETLAGAAEALLQFNIGLIDALYDIVPAVKPQLAYYEAYGWQGMRCFQETVAYAKRRGMYVIADGKRNDIGPTMQAYAAAHLGTTKLIDQEVSAFGADALTVNGYLGTDGITPLTAVCKAQDKGIFVLVKTSNPSSGELQDQQLSTGKTVYDTMAAMCDEWGKALPGRYGYSGVGAVVGATYPEQLHQLRTAYEKTFFLVPGYGAQGGGAEDVRPAFDKNGLGAIVNSSRGILCAWQKAGCAEADYAKAAREEALRMQADLLAVSGKIQLPAP